MRIFTKLLTLAIFFSITSCDTEQVSENETLQKDVQRKSLPSEQKSDYTNREGDTQIPNATFITMVETDEGYDIVNSVEHYLQFSFAESYDDNLTEETNSENFSPIEGERYFITIDEGILEVLLEGGHERQQFGIVEVFIEESMGREYQGILEIFVEESMRINEGALEIVIEGSMDRQYDGILEVFIEGTMGRTGILEALLEGNMGRYGILEIVLEGGMGRHHDGILDVVLEGNVD